MARVAKCNMQSDLALQVPTLMFEIGLFTRTGEGQGRFEIQSSEEFAITRMHHKHHSSFVQRNAMVSYARQYETPRHLSNMSIVQD